MDRIILHLDMDAFFAAIEQLDFPQYRGKPLVVGADPKEGSGRGVVSTCSYEARSYGIRSAMPISKAYRLCPHAVFVPPRGKRYSQVSKAVMSSLLNFTPDIEQISIDEAFLDISSTYKLHGSPEAIARAVKEAVYKETHLTASVGVAPNKFVAKIASDLKKPDGLVIVEKENVKQFLAPLELARLWGVGPKTLPHLEKLGIRTIGELARFSQKEMIRRFGKAGLHFWRLANGIDSRDIEKEVAAKSISKEITFDIDEGDEEKLRMTLFYLCDDLSRLMRRKRLKGRTITLKIRLADFSTFTRSRTLKSSTSDSREIRSLAEGLYSQFDRQGHKVRLLGVGLSHLDGEEFQLDLFEQEPSKTRKIDSLLDQVKEKFGEQAITRASLLDKPRDSMWIRD
jgi:DNA polymerase-4